MPSKKQHSEVGASLGLKEYEKWTKTQGRPGNLAEAIICLAIGGWAAELPDRIEPGTSPDHRGLAHSYELQFILGRFLDDLSNKDDQDFSDLLRQIGLKGYGSHLSMDQRTPKGLFSAIGNFLERLLDRIAK